MPEHDWLDVGAVAENSRSFRVRASSRQSGASRKLNQRLRKLALGGSASPADDQPRPQASATEGRLTSNVPELSGAGRPRTADGTDGLSPTVSRYNRTMEGKVAQALDNVGDAWGSEHTGEILGALRPTHRLESMFAEIHADCDSVREQHLQFVASQERHWKDIAPHYDGTHTHARGAPSRTMVAGGGKAPPRQTAHHSSDNAIFYSAVKAATAYHNIKEEIPLVDKTFKTLTRAQERAMARFDDIDEGKVDRQAVFDAIPSDARRVETKMDYFRERCQLLLPRIEEHFMHLDTKTGVSSVDITKVRSKKQREQPAKHVKSQDQNSTSTLTIDLESTTASSTNKPSTAGTGEISVVPSKCTLLTCNSWESLEQRAARLTVQGHVRDFRIAAARDSERKQLAERRQMQLQAHQSKASRKALATRDRTLFTWIVAAIATEVSVRLWKSFVMFYTEPGSGEGNPLRYTAGYWRSIISAGRERMHLIPAVERLLVVALMRKCGDEQLAERRANAFRTWCQILRPMRFIAVLYRRRRLNSYAEVVKDILNTSWRGYQLRASMKVYLQQMNFLQFSWRCCGRLRNHCRYYLFMPTLWEVETMILGEVIGMPAVTLAAEIEQHRTAWDVKQRMAEIRQLSEIRGQWRDWLEEKVSLAQRVSAYYENSAKHRRSRWLLEKDGDKVSGSCGSISEVPGEHRGKGSLAPPNMMRFIKRREKMNTVHFSPVGKASAVLKRYDSRMGHTLHPLMNLIDKYRLAPEIRNEIVNRMLRDNTDRWWLRYQDYKEQCKFFQQMWLNWRLEIASLGPHNRSVWPMAPPIPRFPSELTKIDEKELHTRVLEALKSTQAGQLL